MMDRKVISLLIGVGLCTYGFIGTFGSVVFLMTDGFMFGLLMSTGIISWVLMRVLFDFDSPLYKRIERWEYSK